jgi:glycosyltransferase involved in cell wall biosynthesis
MTRVLIVCDGLDNGGAERQMALLARKLPEDYAVRVFSLRDGPYAEVLRASGIDLSVHRRLWRRDVTPAFRLWGEVLRWRPDVVHSWGWMSSAAAMVACKALRIPLVDGTIRTGFPSPQWARVNRFLHAHADAVIANSEAGLTAHRLDRPGTFVVHNGFEEDRVPEGCGGAALTGDGPAEVVMAARMAPEKDFDTLLDAAGAMRDRGRHVRFTLMGGGPERERLAARSHELADAGFVRFADVGLEVMPVLAAADVGVLLTDPRHAAEGLSNSIIEYMACGLPVVCTGSGGNREIVAEGRTGLLVAPRDPAAVADALCRLLDEPRTARHFGEAGKERIRAEFSTQAMVEGTIRVYASVMRTA